jgi:hypothetical protein
MKKWRGVHLKQMGIEIKSLNNGVGNLTINMEGMAEDEIELISQSIETLIKQIDLKEMCSDDQVRFNDEMKKIVTAVADNYGSAGIYDGFSLYGLKVKK